MHALYGSRASLPPSGRRSTESVQNGTQGNEMSGIANPTSVLDRRSRFPIESIRSLFPALHREPLFIFFDNAAGAQVPQILLDAVNRHLGERNVHRGGRYRRSQEADASIPRARETVGVFVNARES